MSEGVDTTSLILKLLFSGYSSPKESRFVKYFYSNKIEQKKNPAKRTQKSLNIEPEDILNGKDKRTTIILKNLPNDISKEDLKSIIEPLGNINFIYIPLLIKNKNKHNLPCAYLNVINYKTIVPIFMGLRKHIFNYNNKEIITELYYSKIQGKEELKKEFKLNEKWC